METALMREWLRGRITHVPKKLALVAVSVEARCNLACEHCYWSHEAKNVPSVDWNSVAARLAEEYGHARIVFAGRILNEKGAKFIEQYCSFSKRKIDIIDNGYWILRHPELFDKYEQVSISIDGYREEHDWQRGKIGAFDVALETVSELKRRGYDPVVSSAISPITLGQWQKFEEIIEEKDILLSTTLVYDIEEARKRGTAVFRDDETVVQAFECLVSGVPSW